MSTLAVRAARQPNIAVGGGVLAAVVATAVFAPLLAANDPLDIVGMPFVWPGEDPAFPLGTDMLGRDILSGLFYGARSALQIGMLAGLFATAVGLLTGILAGYFGGWVDSLLMRMAELFQITPSLLLAIAIVAIAGSSTFNIVASITITSWPQVARLVRAETLRVRTSDYVSAGSIMGFGHAHLLVRLCCPMSRPPRS